VRSISNRQRWAALIGRSDRVLRGLVLALVDLCEAAHDEKPTLVTLNIHYVTSPAAVFIASSYGGVVPAA